MATMKPYGLAISNAIAKGDAARLESALNQARTLHEQQGGDLSKAIKAGESALKKLSKAKPAAKPTTAAKSATGGRSGGTGRK